MKNKTSPYVSVVIAAAGSSTRMGGINKQFLLLNKIPVLAHTLLRFSKLPSVSEIIIAARKDDLLLINDMVKDFGIQKVKAVIPGGANRQESVRLGLEHINEPIVLIHDGARPMVTNECIEKVIKQLEACDAAALGVPVKDTIKRVMPNGQIIETLNRDELVQIQTPQGFRSEIIRDAHKRALIENVFATDDCMLAELMGIPVYVVSGDYQNIKITTPEDIAICEAMLCN